jgi:hypothetical protein
MGSPGDPAIRLPPLSTRMLAAQKSMVASVNLKTPPAMIFTFPNL